MEKLNRPANGSWFEEGEIVDADLLVDLLETYRFGKANVPAGEIRSKAAVTELPPENATDKEDEVDNNGSQGKKLVHESILSVSSNSDPIILESTASEIDSNNETSSIEETGYNWLESNSTNLPNVENARHQNAEDGEIEEEHSQRSLSESEEKLNLEKLFAIQETYELYCPSCSSCITRKVILKKRKRTKHIDLSTELKPNVPVGEPDEPSHIEEIEPPVKVHVPETRSDSSEDDDQEEKEEEDMFTCLACLKYFIRLGARFLQLDYIRGKPVEEPEVMSDESASELNETPTDNIEPTIPQSYFATEIDLLDPMAENVPMNSTQQKQSKPLDVSDENKTVELSLEAVENINTKKSPPLMQPDRERFAVEFLKSTVYGGLSETITSLCVVSSASASGSSTDIILALAVANLAGGLIVLAQNVTFSHATNYFFGFFEITGYGLFLQLQDLRNDSDRYEELLGRNSNFRIHILVAVLSYILFGLIPPLVYAFSFYETRIKNHKLVSVFLVSLVCVILLGMIKVYVRKQPNSRQSPKSYLKSAAYYTSIVVASSGISYVVGETAGEYFGKLDWFNLDQTGFTSPIDGTKPEDYSFTSF